MATPNKKPTPTSSLAEQELDRLDGQFKEYEDQVKSLDMNTLSKAPKEETEPQTKMSQNQIANALNKPIYLKPRYSIGSPQKFNEKFREQWEFAKQYVPFIAEHNEMKGDMIEIWTRPYGGVPAEFWQVPTNKPIMGPRHLAEQLRTRSYRRLTMDRGTINSPSGIGEMVASDGLGSWHGQIVAESTISRLNANPVSNKRSIFMGDSSFA